jgi:lysozyme family protein
MPVQRRIFRDLHAQLSFAQEHTDHRFCKLLNLVCLCNSKKEKLSIRFSRSPAISSFEEVIMANFDLFLPILLHLEGGYVHDPTDPGGETNKGITMAVFQHCAHPLLGIEPTSENLKALTDTQAGIIYKRAYWDKICGDQFQSQELANIVCDFYVNAGTHATVFLQRVINATGARVTPGVHVREDGCIGPASLQALNALPQHEVYLQYKQGRINYYLGLSHRFPQFVRGWLNRVNSFPDLIPQLCTS